MSKIVIRQNKTNGFGQIVAQTPDPERAAEIAKVFARKDGAYTVEKITGDYRTRDNIISVFDKSDLSTL